jgi:hypothetical protein
MDQIELLEPFLQGGIRNTNFFNGRLLSAEDLRTEQAASRQQRAQLGRAVGAGVVSGLDVEAGAPDEKTSATTVLNVSAGLALNERGQALELPQEMQVALVRAQDAGGTDAGLFAPCSPETQTAVIAGSGVYVLVIAPASGFAERAPSSGLGGNALTSPGCGSRYAVEGVQFRLLPLDLNKLEWLPQSSLAQLAALMSSNTAAARSKLRNWLAHLCFGDVQLRQFADDPFSPTGDNPPPPYGALDDLRAQGSLTSCDVPLALLYWTSGGIQFVDVWAARRSPFTPTSAGRWALFTSARRQREAEAMFLQFQTQLQELRAAATNLDQLVASDYFAYLPPVGLVPLTGPGGSPGFTYQNFFAGQATRPPAYIEGAAVESQVRTAFNYAPVSLANKDPMWLYQVLDGPAPRPYLIFVSAFAPYQAEARFDFVRWNFSRFYRA